MPVYCIFKVTDFEFRPCVTTRLAELLKKHETSILREGEDVLKPNNDDVRPAVGTLMEVCSGTSQNKLML